MRPILFTECCVQIWIRGPAVAPGYYKNAKATEEAFKNGWLLTGDIGMVCAYI